MRCFCRNQEAGFFLALKTEMNLKKEKMNDLEIMREEGKRAKGTNRHKCREDKKERRKRIEEKNISLSTCAHMGSFIHRKTEMK